MWRPKTTPASPSRRRRSKRPAKTIIGADTAKRRPEPPLLFAHYARRQEFFSRHQLIRPYPARQSAEPHLPGVNGRMARGKVIAVLLLGEEHVAGERYV